jgi:HlyD family secretion protein
VIWLVVLLSVASAAIAVYSTRTRAERAPVVATAPVTRGDVMEAVDATGTLQAVTTVQVGTQVSGTIKTLRADFNTRVRSGDVIAELEPSLFETQVEQARASLTRVEADVRRAEVQLEDAQQKLARARELAARDLIAAIDLETADVNARVATAALQAARAQVVQARASLHQSEVNLAHTVIKAPIDGIVISRNVDVGQTVAASMQAPTLFVIARDLRAMQVEASIAESDVGRVRTGQPVTFRVDAFPTDVFAGTVSQIRLQPVVEQNVVSYVTVIDVPNTDLRLKPGMTANVTIEIARESDVLRVPNAALRVKPSPETLTAPGQPDSAKEPVSAERREGAGAGTWLDHARGEVWVVANGRLTRVPVGVGITDGARTAVFSPALAEGAVVVTSIAGQAAAPASTSPLLPAFRGRGAGSRGTSPAPQPR